MRRLFFPLLAALALVAAGAGIWFGGLKQERGIAQELAPFPRLKALPFYRCADSFYWVSYADQMIATRALRVRFTQMDNAPYGRPNTGWASLNAWYLVALAGAWSIASALPLREALWPAATWSGPLLYFLALAGILALGRRCRNFPAAVLAVLLLATSPRIYDDFAFAVPGHHGWHDLACFATFVLLAAAVRKRNARGWFLAAGVAGAVALWIGATQQLFGLAAAGLGILLGFVLCRFADSADNLPAPEGWRAFGLAGGFAALVFYLVEYAPNPIAMRLEVNHPIYVLGFLLGGELLCRAQRLILGKAVDRRDLLLAFLLLIGLAGIAATVVVGPASWHTMRQPFMQRLHHEISEFQPLALRESWFVLGTPAFLVALAGWRALTQRGNARQRIALCLCAFPCATAIALSFLQLRWAGIAGACAAALAAVLFADFVPTKNGGNSPRLPFSLVVCICLAFGSVVAWSICGNPNRSYPVRAEAVNRLATMEVASVLQSDPKIPRPIALFAGQKERQAWVDLATGVRSVGSLYWDNPDGIRDEAEFLGGYDEAAAHQIARRRGINYIVVAPNGGDVIAYHYMWQGNKNAAQIRQTLAYRLAAPNPAPPPWLQRLRLTSPGARAEDLRVYRVLP